MPAGDIHEQHLQYHTLTMAAMEVQAGSLSTRTDRGI